jgi:hypothetical protein
VLGLSPHPPGLHRRPPPPFRPFQKQKIVPLHVAPLRPSAPLLYQPRPLESMETWGSDSHRTKQASSGEPVTKPEVRIEEEESVCTEKKWALRPCRHHALDPGLPLGLRCLAWCCLFNAEAEGKKSQRLLVFYSFHIPISRHSRKNTERATAPQ